MPWTEWVELAVGAAVVLFVAYGAAEGLLQLSEKKERNAMTPERFLYFLLGCIAVVLAVFLLIWLVDELDEERAESFVRGVDVALGRGWERLAPGRAG